jgi:hypothetical protein
MLQGLVGLGPAVAIAATSFSAVLPNACNIPQK